MQIALPVADSLLLMMTLDHEREASNVRPRLDARKRHGTGVKVSGIESRITVR